MEVLTDKAAVPALESCSPHFRKYNCEAPCLIYNGGLRAEPPAESRGGHRGEAPLKLRTF